MLWYDNNLNDKSVTDSDIVFSLKFKALADGTVSESISLAAGEKLGVAKENQTLGIQLSFENITSYTSVIKSSEVIGFTPNPFNDVGYLEVNLTRDTDLLFELTNLEGKVIYSNREVGSLGENRIKVDEQMIPYSGIYFYRLIFEDKIFTGKIIRH